MRLFTLIKHTFFQDMLDSLLKEFTSWLLQRFIYGQMNFAFSLAANYQKSLDWETTFHCVKSVRIRSYSGPHFSAFGYGKIRIISSIQSKCGKCVPE